MAVCAFLAAGLGFHGQEANAGTACESQEAAKYLPPPPRGCQWQRIEAAGDLSFGILRGADTKARNAWSRQVITFFGERFSDWDMAACKKVLCVEAHMSGSRRCTYSGFPCASDADRAAIEALNTVQVAGPEPDRGAPDDRTSDRELTGDEIRELQELLSRAGYRVGSDGMLGEQTQKALASWRHRMGLPGDGNASLKILEELRKAQASPESQPRRRER